MDSEPSTCFVLKRIQRDSRGIRVYNSSYREVTNCGESTLFPKRDGFLESLWKRKKQEIFFAVFADGQEHNISEVAERVKIAQSTASEHLSILKRAGILGSRKVEKEVFYRLNRRGIMAMLEEIKSHLSCCLDA